VLTYFPTTRIIAGCDEAGRGCLAGPVVAAAVILPKNFQDNILNDSKLLSQKKREQLEVIIKRDAISWAIGVVCAAEIDRINILNASFLAMHKAIKELTLEPEHLLIDGNRFQQYKDIKHQCIVRGDSKYFSIAAASVLAKTHRDNIMVNLDLETPQYKWRNNKGYPTKEHRKAIKNFGISKYHRKSFQLLP
tara:strand:+ start:33266 stop:33841 length:576 start_codon:yes stop_codon:yes gene_type:complete